MEKHIMLLFLSDVKVNQKTGEINSVEYEIAGEAETTNESAVRYLLATGYQGKAIKISQMFLFVSKKVRSEEIYDSGHNCVYRDGNGKSWTHLAYFKERLRDVIPDIDQISKEYPYDEDAPISDAMRMVTEMAAKIQKYIQGEDMPAGSKMVLHADCTGGLRHTNMMMLGIMRLLQYNNIEIGMILYSNYKKKKVEEANEIYHFFDLIAGAEEFVRFGSVSAILDYYHNKDVTEELRALLETMRQFAEEIKLCRYGEFRAAIKNLNQALQNFEQIDFAKGFQGEKRLNHAIMDQIKMRIHLEYKILLEKDLDDLSLIRWCLEHGYFQQAMTLYTERVPEFICVNHLLEVTARGRENFNREVHEDNSGRSRNFYLFNAYCLREKEAESDKVLRGYRKNLKKSIKLLLCKVRDEHMDLPKIETVLQDFLQEVQYLEFERPSHIIEFFSRLVFWRDHPEELKELDHEDKILMQLLKAYEDDWKKCYAKAYEKGENGISCTEDVLQQAWEAEGFEQSYGRKKYKKWIDFLIHHMDERMMKELFSDIRFSYAHKIGWLLEDGWLDTRVPIEELQAVINRYGQIKDERNHSNHAKLKSGNFTVDTLKTCMMDGMQELLELKKKYA